MTHTLTVGFDGSPQSTRAVMWAAGIAVRDDALLRVVACYTAPGVVDPWYIGIPIDMQQIGAAAEQSVGTAIDLVRAEHPTLRVETDVVWESARAELVRRAADSDLLVVGTTGTGAAESLLLGSVAHAVARTSPCPVVLVPGAPPAEPVGRVVVGVDGSPASEHALTWAVDEADRRDAEIVLVHAWQYEYAQEGVENTAHGLLRVDAARVLDRAVELARDRARGPVHRELVEGPAARALIDAAGTADLVVVGSRGRGALRAAIFGSVAHAVAAASPRPTVVVRAPSSGAARR